MKFEPFGFDRHRLDTVMKIVPFGHKGQRSSNIKHIMWPTSAGVPLALMNAMTAKSGIQRTEDRATHQPMKLASHG